MPIFTSMERSRWSKYKQSSGKKGEVWDRMRNYILHELGTDDNFGGDRAYAIVDDLDERFLKDSDLGAGLAVCLYEITGTAETLSLTGAADRMDVDKYISEEKQKAIRKATQFFGRGRKDYQSKLKEILNQWETQQDARQSK